MSDVRRCRRNFPETPGGTSLHAFSPDALLCGRSLQVARYYGMGHTIEKMIDQGEEFGELIERESFVKSPSL